jgi:hypothetical protein
MNCQSCRDALTALLDQELAAGEKVSVENHLNSCPDCSREYDSLRYAFGLTEQIESIPLNPAIWDGIQSEIESLASPPEGGIGRFLNNLLLPPRRVTVAAGIAIAILVILFFSFPGDTADPVLEAEFTQFIEAREATSRKNRRILYETPQDANYRSGNPFVKPVSHQTTNPFRK